MPVKSQDDLNVKQEVIPDNPTSTDVTSMQIVNGPADSPPSSPLSGLNPLPQKETSSSSGLVRSAVSRLAAPIFGSKRENSKQRSSSDICQAILERSVERNTKIRVNKKNEKIARLRQLHVQPVINEADGSNKTIGDESNE